MRKICTVFLMLLCSGTLFSGETLRIADASRNGLKILKSAALEFYLANRTPVSVERTAPEKARELLKKNKADLIVLEHADLPEKHTGICRLIGIELFVLYVHAGNPAENVSVEQIRQVFSTRRPVWQQLIPARKTDIHLFGLNERADGYGLGERLLKLKNFTPPVFKVSSTSQVQMLLSSNPAALGYGTWLPTELPVKMLSVNHIPPTTENAVTGKYPLALRCYILAPEKISPAAGNFLKNMEKHILHKK